MNTFGNWQDTEAIIAQRFNIGLARAQQRHDEQEPPEDYDCEEAGHKWRPVRGQAPDGTRFVRCTRCRLEIEA